MSILVYSGIVCGIQAIKKQLFSGQKQFWIDHRIIQDNTPVQVCAGNASGLADGADNISPVNCLSGLHRNRVHMAVHGNQPLTVIDKDSITIKKIITGINHLARCRRFYGGAQVGCKIKAAVWITGLIVKKTF